MKVYDTFLFNNELDLLEIRFNVLNDYVDYFVLVEANETFTNKQKPLYFKNNKDRYKKWEDKIIHFVVDNSDVDLWNYSKSSPNVGVGQPWWVREFYQKENILKAFSANDDDIICVSDLDEIWNPRIINRLKFENKEVYRPIQTAYHYYLNNKSNQDICWWVGTRIGLYETLKEKKVNHFRTEHFTPSIMVKNGGWHFTNIGDPNFIREKIEAYGHQEFNHAFIKNSIKDAIKYNVDFLGRGFSLVKDESELPDYLKNNKEKYKHLFF
jgi:beta-1,4-mannosyl-glycoprotein beta-1,4-N-acetylglucosaminyltransferase